MKSSLLALILPLVLLAGCSTPPPPPAPSEPVDLTQGQPLNIDVKQILLIDRTSDQPAMTPVVDNQFKPTLDGEIRNWAAGAVLAVGATGQGSFTISNAYVTENAIPIDRNWYERKQASKFVAHAEISFEAQGQDGYGLATATASREVTLPEKPTEDERRWAYTKVINGIMQDLAKYLDESIHGNLRDFIVTAPVLNIQPVAPRSFERDPVVR